MNFRKKNKVNAVNFNNKYCDCGECGQQNYFTASQKFTLFVFPRLLKFARTIIEVNDSWCRGTRRHAGDKRFKPV